MNDYVFSYDDGSGTFVDDPTVKFIPKDGWWDEDWSYRREITVDNTAGAEMLTDHTVLISVDT